MEISLNYEIAENPIWYPPHTIPAKVEDLVLKFHESNTRIQNQLKLEANREYFEDYGKLHCLIFLREIVVGESILPSATSIDDVEELLKISNQPPKAALKVQNLSFVIQKLFPKVMDPASTWKIDHFTPEFLKSIHRDVGQGIIKDCGEYRTKQACPAQESWVYMLPDKIPSNLENLCSFIRKEVKAIEDDDLQSLVKISATFLTNFLHIHPFSNGNGRVARLAVSCLLSVMSVVPVPVCCFTNQSRNVYLECMRNSRTFDNPVFKPEELARLVLDSMVEMNQNVMFCLDLD